MKAIRDLSPLELPTDHPRPSVQTYCGATHIIEIQESLTEALRGLSRTEGTTLFMTILAAFQGLLHRYTGQDDIVVMTLLAGGDPAGVKGVMRINASGDPVFRELLDQVRRATIDAYPHLDVSFEQLQPGQGLSCNPLFQVMFALQNVPYSTTDMEGLIMKTAELENTRTPFDLQVHLWETEEGLKGAFVYNTDLFYRATIERMAGHYQRILEGIVADPEQRLSELPLLTEAERHQMLVEWNDTAVDYPRDKCIHKLFEEQAEKVPDAVAVVFKDRKITYRELNERANQLARGLRSEGVRSDVVVGIMINRSIDMISGLLGVLKAGGAYLPIDPENPDSRIEYMLKDSDARVLLTQESLMNRLAYDGHRIALDRDSFIKEDASDLDVTGSSRDLAYVIYTSGSTGTPKGVMVEHRSVVNLSTWFDGKYELAKNRNIIQNTTFSFDVAMEEIISTLINGACLFIPEKEETLDKHKFRAFIKKNRINIAQFVPVTLREFLADAEKIDCLNIVITAGEALDEHLKEQILQKGYTLYNNYGPSETTVDVLSTECGNERVTIGKPISNTKCYILDKRFNPVPVGVAGELTIGGEGLARGYLSRPELTAEKFIPDPFSDEPGARMYRTGDLARYLPDGNIEFLGRIDNQVKVRGHRIELGEIESQLRHHPEVRETVVIAREDQPGVKRLVAYVVFNQGTAILTSKLWGFLKAKIPDYMVPSAFIVLDVLPLMPNGKVDRKALPDHVPERSGLDDSFIGPRTTSEELLAGIWCEVLGLKKVSIHDNFFELGGHSLLAIQVMSRLRNAFQVEIPLRHLFETPTVAGLTEVVMAALIAREQRSAPPFVAVSREDELPLSYAQERLWLHNQLEPNTSNNIPLALRIRGNLNRNALATALNTILGRHESLRTTFSSETEGPLQMVQQAGPLPIFFVDMGGWPEAGIDAVITRLITEEVRRTFDLSTDLMVRATLIKLSDTEHILILTMHHIASDGWSIGIFFQELSALYRSAAEGRPSPLADLPIQYADFACWQRKWMQGEVFERQLAYWRDQLAHNPAVLELPADRPRPAVRSLQGASHGITLPEILVDRLTQLCNQEGVTMFTLMMAALKTLLYRLTGHGDICVGTFVANRNRVEIEGLIGFFVNTLALRTHLSDGLSFRQLLNREHENALGAFAHQDIPFEKILEAVNPKRDLSYTPLFQVALAFENVPRGDLELPDLSLEFMNPEPSISLYDLSLIIEDFPEGIFFTYRTDIFESSTIKRWADNFLVLLESIAANPEGRIETLPLLTEAEKKQLVVEWNNTSIYYPGGLCVHEMFEAQVENNPDAVAVVYEGQELTYLELNRRANQLARFLHKLGVGTEVLVGICVDRSLEMLVGLLGILKAGGAYVPMDPAYPQERLKLMLEDANIAVLLTQKRHRAELPLQKARLVCLDTDWDDIACESYENPANRATLNNAAYVIYTSGSTGKPKGVIVEHKSLANYTRAASSQYGIKPSARVLQFASISFDASVEEIYPCLAQGATLVLRTDEMLSSVRDFLHTCEEWKLTVLSLPTIYWHELIQGLETEDLKMPDTIRLVIIGGEKASSERLMRWNKQGDTQVRLLNTYGPTEATVVATMCDLTHTVPRDGLEQIPIGQPMPNVQTYIMDSHLQPVPIGVPGELYIGGNGLARGYLNRPELTAEKFIPNPFKGQPGTRLYKTGDLARYLPDGNIEFMGRIDLQVKIRGFRIELGEIETVLRQHPAVRETAAVAQEDQRGNKRLIAYVVFNQNAAILTSELRSFLKLKIPDYMIPSAFVVLDSLPLTPSGKVDRRALPAPDSERPGEEDSYVAPRTPIEEVLAGIWCEILGLKEVGIHDNFFALGGHSLLATQVMSRLRKVFEIEIPLRTLFESPTVGELALALLQREGEREKLEQRAALLLKVAELSEDEVNTMLAEQIRKRHNKKNG